MQAKAVVPYLVVITLMTGAGAVLDAFGVDNFAWTLGILVVIALCAYRAVPHRK